MMHLRQARGDRHRHRRKHKGSVFMIDVPIFVLSPISTPKSHRFPVARRIVSLSLLSICETFDWKKWS